MVSVVICSANPGLYEQVALNINESIGLPFEIIRIDNAGSEYGLCRAYNIGAAMAVYPYLCFVHEDVIFRSAAWAPPLVEFLRSQPEAGLIGIAGSRYKSLAPSSWANGLHATDFMRVIQQHIKYEKAEHNEEPSDGQLFHEVVVLDGVFLFTKKEIWAANRFDEQQFDRFHGYDTDFSMQVGLHSKLYVTYSFLLEHLSPGSLNAEWVTYAISVSRKWKRRLPLGDLSTTQKKDIEWRNRKILLLRMNILGLPPAHILKIFLGFGFFRFFSFKRIMSFTGDIISFKLRKRDTLL